MASPKVVLVTGGNSGIGYEIVKALLQSSLPYHIHLAARSLAKANGAITSLKSECPDTTSTVSPLQLDLISDDSITAAHESLKTTKPGHLDVLINNAGATFDLAHLAGKVSLRESFNQAYDVNVAGTHVLTHTLIPLLLKSSDPRLLFVTGLANITAASEKYFPTPPLPAGWPKPIDFEVIGYRCTKCALNMLMVDWQHKLKEDGVKVWCVAPGFLATNLGGMPEMAVAMGAGHPRAGGDIVRRVVEGERDGDVGKIVAKDGLSQW